MARGTRYQGFVSNFECVLAQLLPWDVCIEAQCIGQPQLYLIFCTSFATSRYPTNELINSNNTLKSNQRLCCVRKSTTARIHLNVLDTFAHKHIIKGKLSSIQFFAHHLRRHGVPWMNLSTGPVYSSWTKGSTACASSKYQGSVYQCGNIACAIFLSTLILRICLKCQVVCGGLDEDVHVVFFSSKNPLAYFWLRFFRNKSFARVLIKQRAIFICAKGTRNTNTFTKGTRMCHFHHLQGSLAVQHAHFWGSFTGKYDLRRSYFWRGVGRGDPPPPM